MGILERIFSRQFASARRDAASRAAHAVREGIAHAMEARSGSTYYGQKWRGGLSSPSPVLNIDHARLRQQGRVLEQHSLQARGIINTDVDTTVDSGLVLVPEPRAQMLGLTDEEAEAWSGQVATAFDSYMQSKRSSRSEMYNGYQAQRLVWRYRSRDNEAFIRHYYSQDPTLLSPLQFEILDPDQIRGDAFTATSFAMLNDDGIERDSAGREINYKIWTQDPKTLRLQSVTIPRLGPKSGRTFMTHGFAPMYAGQGRGFSEFGVSVQDLELILDLSLAHVKKAINQSNIYATAKNSKGDTVDPLRDYEGGSAGPGATIPAPTEAEQELIQQYYMPIPEATIDVPGSVGLFNSPQGQEITPFINTSPAEAYNAFVDCYFAYIAAAHNQSIEFVLKKFGSSYNANRVTLSLIYRGAVMRRYLLACDHLDPLYESWLAEEIAAGRVSCPGWQDPRLRAAWLGHRWQGLSMPDMDPVKTMQAAKGFAELGATDLDEIATDHNGSSGKSNRARLKRQYAELPEPAWGWGKGGGEAPEQKQGPEDQGDEKQEGAN